MVNLLFEDVFTLTENDPEAVWSEKRFILDNFGGE